MNAASVLRPRAIGRFNASIHRQLNTSSFPLQFRAIKLSQRPIAQSPLYKSFRRTYADLASPPRPKKKAGYIRWTWRLTKFSFVASVAYLSWTIYDSRTPRDQVEPDPSKKTLVVLGKLNVDLQEARDAAQRFRRANIVRHGMGLSLTSQKAGYRELQRNRSLSSQLLPFHSSSAVMYNRNH